MFLFLKDTANGNVRRATYDEPGLLFKDDRVVLTSGSPRWNFTFLSAHASPVIGGHHQDTGELHAWIADEQGDYGPARKFGGSRIGPEWKLQFTDEGGGLGGFFGHNQNTQQLGFWRIASYDAALVPTTGLDSARIGAEWDLHLLPFHLYQRPDHVAHSVDILGLNRDTGDLHVWFTNDEWRSQPRITPDDFHAGQIGLEWRLQPVLLGRDAAPTLFGQSASGELHRWESPLNTTTFSDDVSYTTTIPPVWNLRNAIFLGGFEDVIGQTAAGALHLWQFTHAVLVNEYDLQQFPGTKLLPRSRFFI